MKYLSERIWGHGQNLNQHGSMFWHGRAWLCFPTATLDIEWALGKQARFCCAEIQFNDRGDSQVQIHVALPWLFSIFLTLESVQLLRRWLPGHWQESSLPGHEGGRYWNPEDRRIGVSIYDGTIWISLWKNPMEWYRGQPWWWEFSITPKDILLGRAKYSRRELDSGTVAIPMPEGAYKGDYTIFESTWQRPRWPRPRRMIRVEMDATPPIPVPGKGENSWDCGDDAIWSITCPVSTGREAAERFKESALQTRKRYAGPNWVPVDGWPIHLS